MEFRRQRARAEELEEFRLGFLRRGSSKNASLEWVPALRIEKAQRGEAVEPSVSDALDKGGTIPPLLLAERCHLISSLAEIWRVGGEHVVELTPDRLHELGANGGSEGFEFGSVHVEKLSCEESFWGGLPDDKGHPGLVQYPTCGAPQWMRLKYFSFLGEPDVMGIPIPRLGADIDDLADSEFGIFYPNPTANKDPVAEGEALITILQIRNVSSI